MVGGVTLITVVHIVKFQFLDQSVLLEEVQGIVDGRQADGGGLFPGLAINGKGARMAYVAGKDAYDFEALAGKLQSLFPEALDYCVFDLFRLDRAAPSS